jgi:glycogen(starch) synthase
LLNERALEGGHIRGYWAQSAASAQSGDTHKVRILYWSEFCWPYVGGPELFARRFLKALQDRGHEAAVITSHSHLDLPDRTRLDGIPIYRFPMRAALAAADAETIARLSRQIGLTKQELAPDVIHVSGVGPSAIFQFTSARAYPAPLVISLRTEVLDSQRSPAGSMLGRAISAASWVTAVSSSALEQARELAPEIRDRSSVVHNFLETPELAPAPLPFDPPVALCLGRFITAKGFDLALKAFAEVLVKYPQARLVLAGDGPEEPHLRQFARSLGLDEAVRFLGPVTPRKVPALLNSVTLAVLPSRREGLPMVAAEAGIMARPIVASRTGGLPELIVHGQTGLLVPQEDASALANAICQLFASPTLASDMGREARTRAQAMFARDRCLDAYLQIYERLRSSGPASGFAEASA